MIGLLRGLVDAETPSSMPESHTLARSILLNQFAELGYRTRLAGASNGPRHIFARPARRRHRRCQLVVGHYDTVWPLGTTAKRPFEVEGNVVRGPGTFDMKGGLVQLILALRAIRETGCEPPLDPLIFMNADEEIGSRTSGRYVRWLARISDRAFVLEPALGERGALKTERKGVGRYTVTVYGKAAHAGLDAAAGASAILELSHVIQQLFALNDVDAGISVNVGTIEGGVQPNVVAAHSRAIVDVRVPSLEAGKRIDRALRAIRPVTNGVRIHVEGGIGRPSMELNARNEALWLQARAIGDELGLNLESARAGGGSDGNTTSQYTATLDGLGPVGDGAHAEHEFLFIDKTLERTALLAMLLMAPPAAGENND